MNQEEIKQILPHRDNMLLVERAELTGENDHDSEAKNRSMGSFF